MTPQRRIEWPWDAETVAGRPPSRIDPPTVLGDMAALDLAAATPGDHRGSTSLHVLPEGTRLLDCEIVGLIGEGGFGIVYLAYDATLERHVAIKEYLPAALASRTSSQAVMVKSPRHAEAFRTGLRSFVNEARLLARFDHPSLVKVLRFWEANGTAYMVMPFYEGPTLAHALQTLGRRPTEDELLDWLRPLLHALSTLHAVRCYHRDIAPDNILLTPAGPLLLDFGAARRVADQAAASPTVVIKPGYAPIEQYGEAPTLKQGPWTDLYALAGVVYAAITGEPPMPAVERWIDDRHRPLSRCAQDGYSAHFLAAIDAALALRPADRPASAAAFWLRLRGPNATHAPWSAAAPPAACVAPAGIEPDTLPTPLTTPAPGAVAETPAPPAMAPAPDTAAVFAPALPQHKLRGRYVLAAVLLMAVGAGALLPWRAPRPLPEALPVVLPLPRDAPPAPAAVAAPSPKPAPAEAPVEAPVAVPAEVPIEVSATVPEAPAAPPRPVPAAAPREPTPARPPREAAKPPPASVAGSSQRCTELLQRASLETLRPAELSFLTRECRP